MKPHELLDDYTAMSTQDRLEFLSRLAANLTVEARGTYVPGTDQIADGPRLREFNELQHRVLGHLHDLITKTADRFPDDAICEIIVAGTQELKAGWALQQALKSPPTSRSRRKKAVAAKA